MNALVIAARVALAGVQLFLIGSGVVLWVILIGLMFGTI